LYFCSRWPILPTLYHCARGSTAALTTEATGPSSSPALVTLGQLHSRLHENVVRGLYSRESIFSKSRIFKFQKVDLGGENNFVAWIELKVDRWVCEKEQSKAAQGKSRLRPRGVCAGGVLPLNSTYLILLGPSW
jgi:hypothetical protein